MFRNLKSITETQEYITYKATTGPSKPINIPKYLTKEFAVILGIMLGDGHLMKNRKRLSLELTNEPLLKYIALAIENIFQIKVKIRSRLPKNPDWKILYYFYIDNSAMFQLFEQLGVPKGKKSSIIRVPKIIQQTKNLELKKAFAIGVLLAEGGTKKKKSKYGMSSASEGFIQDMIVILNELEIRSKFDKWFNKRYKREYFALYFKKTELSLLNAGVPEWSNGLIHK